MYPVEIVVTDSERNICCTQGGGDDWQKVGDDKRGGRRDDKPTKVDPKRITSLLRRERGDRSKDVSHPHRQLVLV